MQSRLLSTVVTSLYSAKTSNPLSILPLLVCFKFYEQGNSDLFQELSTCFRESYPNTLRALQYSNVLVTFYLVHQEQKFIEITFPPLSHSVFFFLAQAASDSFSFT